MNTSNFQKSNHICIILKTAVCSRLFLLALIIFWRSLFEPYDTSAPLNPNCLSLESQPADTVLWPKIGAAIEGSIVWDAVYFVRIAQCGYEYEQSYAFLPLLPICISFLSRTVFAPLIPLIGHRAVLGLSGYVLNNIAFVLAAVYFYKLSVIILKDKEAAFRASILFCFNPASIFYSSIYSESLYALLSVGGVYHLISSSNNVAVLWLALSGSARSNGVLNAGYFCFQTMHEAYEAIFLKKRAYLSVQVLLVGVLRCLCIFVPFVAFQAYGYYNICLGHFPDEMSPWCKARVPLVYNYLQSHYWGVGFLRYFQLKQLPNFLLASPILSLALCSIIHYMRLQPEIFFSLGFRASPEEKNSAAVLFSLGADKRSNSDQFSKKSIPQTQENHNLRRRKQLQGEESAASPTGCKSSARLGYLSAFVLPFVLHLGFMAATAFFVMHVQVSTRFLSASPPLYWFASYLMVSRGAGRRWGYLIWAYSAAYILLGSLLFSNFYPFT
ncbi:GPI mannosyltransferase 2 [Vitis riparia]|uniref:GPI mannosyltransferase 2 n=1 Tax=Vitis riparia TaxID=96939 RepID=UPI00155AB603|nr:GPI mannosyltransferase 2 [Vitis riparia]